MSQTQEPGIFSGEDVEEAIGTGLTELGLTRDQVEIEVLDEGARGVLGIGGRPARVCLIPTAPPAVEETEPAKVAREVLTELLERLGFTAEVEVSRPEPASDEEDSPLKLDVRGPGVGTLIGRKGETLAALQRIVRLIVGSRFARWVHLVVDVDGYKQRREESLRRLAGRMAEEAVRSGRTVVLEPMPPYERRIVHLALREDVDVRTQSVGTGNRRRVTIIPQEDERPEDTHTGESTP